jgi:uncharacterized protein
VIVYAESSAVVAWLFGEAQGEAVRRELSRAAHVVTARLTRVECMRTITRAEQSGRIAEREAVMLRAQVARTAASWTHLDAGDEVEERVARAFPIEPVRTLDALHLATALLVRAAEPGVVMLSLDERVRENALALGFAVRPAFKAS